MPAGDGFEVAKRIQKHPNTVGLPLIFMTASQHPDLRKRAQDFSPVAFFRKPTTHKSWSIP
jgi:CheY-like chemotaxis protein